MPMIKVLCFFTLFENRVTQCRLIQFGLKCVCVFASVFQVKGWADLGFFAVFCVCVCVCVCFRLYIIRYRLSLALCGYYKPSLLNIQTQTHTITISHTYARHYTRHTHTHTHTNTNTHVIRLTSKLLPHYVARQYYCFNMNPHTHTPFLCFNPIIHIFIYLYYIYGPSDTVCSTSLSLLISCPRTQSPPPHADDIFDRN